MAQTGGTLYAIRAEGTSLVKIGYTTGSVEKRLKTLQTGQPFRLRVIETVVVESEARQHETLLHKFLTEQRRSGEWFEIDLRDKSLSDLLARAIEWGVEQEAQRQAAHAQKELLKQARIARHTQRKDDPC